MGRKRTHTPEEIVAKLRQVEVLTAQGKAVAEAARSIGVTEQTFYRWRAEFGGLKLDQVKRLKQLEAENARLRRAVLDLTLEKLILKEAASGNFRAPRAVGPASSTSRRSWAYRSASRAGCWASTARRSARRRACPTTKRRCGRRSSPWPGSTGGTATGASRRCCGWRAGAPTTSGWNGSGGVHGTAVNGLKVPPRQPKRGRLWLADGSCVRLRPERPNHVWAYDFVEDRTRDGRKFRMLCVVDEFTREALAIRVARKLGAADVIDTLADLFIARGVPAHIRSDNGPEFAAKAVRGWIAGVGARTAFIELGSPWENGYVESFNGKLRDELLDGEVFNTLREAQVLIEQWRQHYNTVRPHSALGYRPPAPEVAMPGTPMLLRHPNPTGSAPPATMPH